MSKDSYYFKHDQNARHDPKIQVLIEDYGLEGYGRFWVIVEMLRENDKHKLENKNFVWLCLAHELKAPVLEVKKFIKDCVEKYELFIQEDGFFYSAALLKRMAVLDELRAKRKRAAEIRWDKE